MNVPLLFTFLSGCTITALPPKITWLPLFIPKHMWVLQAQILFKPDTLKMWPSSPYSKENGIQRTFFLQCKMNVLCIVFIRLGLLFTLCKHLVTKILFLPSEINTILCFYVSCFSIDFYIFFACHFLEWLCAYWIVSWITWYCLNSSKSDLYTGK